MAWSLLGRRRWAQIPFGVPGTARGLPPSPRLPRQCWRLKSSALVTCIAVIGAADLLLWLWKVPRVIVALSDESAHVATGLVALGACGVAFEAPVVGAVLAGSVLIDLDHVPDLLGSDVLQHGIPRPYTHSLATVVVLVGAALLLPSKTRKLMLVAALALLLHFFRDIAEPGGPGVALLWPFSDHAYTLEYGWYAGALVLLTAIALAIRTAPSWRPRRFPRSPRTGDRA
jgi:inner membrane protein